MTSDDNSNSVTLEELADRIDCLQKNIASLKRLIYENFNRYFALKEDEKVRRREGCW